MLSVLRPYRARAEPGPPNQSRRGRLPCATGGRFSPRQSGQSRAKSSPRPLFQPRTGTPSPFPPPSSRALVKHKVYPDPVFGMNLRSFPGSHLSHRHELLQHPDAAGQPLHRARGGIARNFVLPASYKGKTIWLNFRRNQLSRQHLAERQADRQFRTTSPALGAPTSSTSPTRSSRARRTCWPWKCSRQPTPIWPSRSSTGTPRPRQEHGPVARRDITTSGPVALRYPDGRFESRFAGNARRILRSPRC